MDDTSNLITNWGYAAMIANEDEATAGRQRRLNLSLMEQYENISVENSALQRTKRQLIDENTVLRAVLVEMANRSEALCRVIDHLRAAWSPEDPAELSFKQDCESLDIRMRSKVAADMAWPADRDKVLAGWLEWGKAQPKPKRR